MAQRFKIDTVNTSHGWAARLRDLKSPGYTYVLAERPGVKYTMQQAQLAAEALRRHLNNGGDSYARPLPGGVTILK